jgi:predicted membrane protein
MSDRPRPLVTPGLVFGLLIIAVGSVLLLWNLGIIDGRAVFRFWPVLLIVAGVAKILQSQGAPGRLWGGVLAGAGVLLLVDRLGVFGFRLGPNIWPLLMIAFGLVLIWRTLEARKRDETATPGADGSYLNHWTAFGGLEIQNNSPEFRGGEALAVFGGLQIDLRKAALASSEVVLHLYTAFGGIELRVPENWSVVSKGVAVFGGYEDKTSQPRLEAGSSANRLVLKGFAVFGGVEIKN